MFFIILEVFARARGMARLSKVRMFQTELRFHSKEKTKGDIHTWLQTLFVFSKLHLYLAFIPCNYTVVRSSGS